MAQNKFLVVLDEITGSSPDEIQSLKLLAEYLSSKNKQESIVSQLDHKLASNVENDTLVIVAATIYVNQNNLEAAFRVLHTSESLEALAFIIDILLKIDRVDLARKKLKDMQEKDDDATLTQLAQAWVNTAMVSSSSSLAFWHNCVYYQLVIGACA